MADGNLADHVALVTGAAHRLGRATARQLHAAGADVAIHYHTSRAEAEALAEELEARGPARARAFGCALEDTANLAPLVESVAAAFGGLDILVNNAARFYPTPLREASEAAWDDLLGTNLKAPFFLAQAAQEYLEERGGAIISLADVYAERPLEHHAVYSISKAGLVMLTRALAKEMGPRVRVNAVAPGAALWPESGKSEQDKEAILRHTALARASGPEPIAEAVHFLARADYITGQVLGIEGGRLLY
ncbi:pteridine reductase [Thiohalorhabdus denitrificans]|uniref:Pteridine reductase n=1 Tax=Thiohalorhabdus denitrificans TaxID=381306 RepID=A0A0P9EFB0_9GAMM|nr:pteridine reductase [Thiohalorhabdus denitrificans]KPV41038.1 pteridine reductase [Thiohalorhabdus denitrificans]SCY40767.1 pteridine reductase [Thiohalorhabdus denitrificans]